MLEVGGEGVGADGSLDFLFAPEFALVNFVVVNCECAVFPADEYVYEFAFSF